MAAYRQLRFLWIDRMAIPNGDDINYPDGFQPRLVVGKH